mmetsp:Transcript_3409/g.8372  ORF Transcript_3409/g.8372 Transcript_3409/m.8372 type:complete len:254 (-) Transcript_3409:2-763(-)
MQLPSSQAFQEPPSCSRLDVPDIQGDCGLTLVNPLGYLLQVACTQALQQPTPRLRFYGTQGRAPFGMELAGLDLRAHGKCRFMHIGGNKIDCHFSAARLLRYLRRAEKIARRAETGRHRPRLPCRRGFLVCWRPWRRHRDKTGGGLTLLLLQSLILPLPPNERLQLPHVPPPRQPEADVPMELGDHGVVGPVHGRVVADFLRLLARGHHRTRKRLQRWQPHVVEGLPPRRSLRRSLMGRYNGEHTPRRRDSKT